MKAMFGSLVFKMVLKVKNVTSCNVGGRLYFW